MQRRLMQWKEKSKTLARDMVDAPLYDTRSCVLYLHFDIFDSSCQAQGS